MTDTHRPSDDRGLADRRRLIQLAYRFVWNKADAEDVVQNALVLAHEKRDELRDPSRWFSWVCRIVLRQSLLLRRGERRHADHALRQAASIVDPAGGAVDRMEVVERVDLVRWAIGQLPQQQQIAVTLRHLQAMSYERMAEIMEISPSTARVHVRAAREAMRKMIVRRDAGFGAAVTTGESESK